MCGIVGFVSSKPNEELINKLVHSIIHRGPDESNYEIFSFGNKYLHLGSSRLSITGINDGSMPMNNLNGDSIVFNGEIYELSELKKNINSMSQTNSDTRYLFEFLSQNHPNDIYKINGMFAFAYFNRKKRTLMLSRDRFGIKPLYYSKNKNFDIIFSSEIKPLIENNLVSNEIATHDIENYLLFGGSNIHNEIFNNIVSVKPGNYLKLNIEGKISEQPYIRKSDKLNHISYVEKEFVDLFRDTIQDQLVADVPVDLFLSGGIDSSILALFIYKFLEREINSFTLSFRNSNMDEFSNAETVADNFGININKIIYPSNRNSEIIEELMSKIPEPIADPSIIPTYYLSQQVSKRTKSVITGDGADELFGGYDWYRASKIKSFIPHSSVLKIINTLTNNYKSSSNIGLHEKIERFSKGYDKSFLIDILFWQNNTELFSEEFAIKKYTEYIDKLNLENKLKDLNSIRELDLINYLYSNILKKSDISSMLNGLEIRPVFLDNRITEYAKKINLNKNVTLFSGKNNLRKILKIYISDVARKSKQGFSHDFDKWTDDVGVPFISKYKKDFEFVSNFQSNFHNNNNPYLKSRATWSIYSILKWIEINKVSIK